MLRGTIPLVPPAKTAGAVTTHTTIGIKVQLPDESTYPQAQERGTRYLVNVPDCSGKDFSSKIRAQKALPLEHLDELIRFDLLRPFFGSGLSLYMISDDEDCWFVGQRDLSHHPFPELEVAFRQSPILIYTRLDSLKRELYTDGRSGIFKCRQLSIKRDQRCRMVQLAH